MIFQRSHWLGMVFSLSLFAVCRADEPKAPAKPNPNTTNEAALSMEATVESELSNRRLREEAEAWLLRPAFGLEGSIFMAGAILDEHKEMSHGFYLGVAIILLAVLGHPFLTRYFEKEKTLAIAESCSGGFVSHLVTSVPGCSVYYRGSIIPYSNDLKQKVLNITPVHFTTVGAVSEEVAIEMALHVKEVMKTDYAISTTGIAGPGGATAEKQVGTVWIGIATPTQVFAKKVLLGDNRLRVIQLAAITALNMLRKELLRGD